MSRDHGTVYILEAGADDEWVSPEPADEVIADAVVEATDLERGDIDDVESYVDLDDLAAVVGDGDDDAVTFAVEGHDVTVTADGDVSVE